MQHPASSFLNSVLGQSGRNAGSDSGSDSGSNSGGNSGSDSGSQSGQRSGDLTDGFSGALPGGLGRLLTGPGGLATGAVAGGLAGLLLGGKKPRKLAKSALKLGGAAAVGGLAYGAWQKWQQGQSSPSSSGHSAGQAADHTTGRYPNSAPGSSPGRSSSPPQGISREAGPQNEITPDETALIDAGFLPNDTAAQDALTATLVRAMIAAAKADGHISAGERTRIGTQLAKLRLPSGHQAFIEAELAKPLNIDEIADSAQSAEQAAEIYMASLLIIDDRLEAHRWYLARLASKLHLDSALVATLHASAEAASVA